MAVEGCGRYEQPLAPFAPLVLVDCGRPRMLKSSISIAEVSVARHAEEETCSFVNDKLILASHCCSGRMGKSASASNRQGADEVMPCEDRTKYLVCGGTEMVE